MKLSEVQRARVRRLLGSNSTSFVELAQAAELDPATAFREADLRRINFGADDLTGFDFTGADLRGANISQARGVSPEMLTDAHCDEATRGFVIRDFPGGPEMVILPAGNVSFFDINILFQSKIIENTRNSANPGGQYRGKLAIRQAVLNAQAAQRVLRTISVRSPFMVGRYQVTQGEFEQFRSETGYPGPAMSLSFAKQSYQLWQGTWPGSKQEWQSVGFEPGERHPVVCVSFDDAKAYVAWATRKSGKEYFLPSTDTWEFSARAGANTRFHWGDEEYDAWLYANFAPDEDDNLDSVDGRTANTNDIGRFIDPTIEVTENSVYCDPINKNLFSNGFLFRVGLLKPNTFGLYDTLGNVWEWCDSSQVDGNSGTLVTGDNVVGEAGGDIKTLRGGSCVTPSDELGIQSSKTAGSDLRDKTVGFRVCRHL